MKITVHLVRHGEREDEAIRKSRKVLKPHERNRTRKLTRMDIIDPFLTSKGHAQAMLAWRSIFLAYETKQQHNNMHTTNDQKKTKHKIAFFTSPLKRAIGTALMVSTANFLPSDHVDVMTLSSSSVLPIIVLDGLCSCTAAIDGQLVSTIHKGYIPCSANYNHNFQQQQQQEQQHHHQQQSTPFLSSMEEIQKRSLPAVESVLAHNNNHQKQQLPRQDSVEFTRLIHIKKNSCSSNDIKKEQAALATPTPITPTTPATIPLSPPLTASHKMGENNEEPIITTKVTTTTTDDTKSRANSRSHTNETKSETTATDTCTADTHTTFYGALVHAVQIAAKNGCDTTVAVGHREGIREMFTHCQLDEKYHRIRLPYCCIGTFQVEVDDDFSFSPMPTITATPDHSLLGERSMKWSCHSVSPYENFSPADIPSGL